jgi:hypothetical protein
VNTGTLAAPTLVLDPSGNGTTRWEDCNPGRTDIPRRLPEIPVLGITPLDADADASAAGSGWCFRRTPRPGQGRITGETTNGLLLVLISPKHPEGGQALRDWADFIHINHIAAAAVPGYMMITPYENAGAGPRYLHFYEMHTDDPESTYKTMTPLVKQRLERDAFIDWTRHPELEIEYVSTYRLIGG